MIARPKMSQIEWEMIEIYASKVGNSSPFAPPGTRQHGQKKAPKKAPKKKKALQKTKKGDKKKKPTKKKTRGAGGDGGDDGDGDDSDGDSDSDDGDSDRHAPNPGQKTTKAIQVLNEKLKKAFPTIPDPWVGAPTPIGNSLFEGNRDARSSKDKVLVRMMKLWDPHKGISMHQKFALLLLANKATIYGSLVACVPGVLAARPRAPADASNSGTW